MRLCAATSTVSRLTRGGTIAWEFPRTLKEVHPSKRCPEQSAMLAGEADWRRLLIVHRDEVPQNL